jgi:hypothetical protein
MKKNKILPCVMGLLCASTVFAKSETIEVTETIKLKDVKCDTFLEYDAGMQPKIIYWSASNLNQDNDKYVDIKVMEEVVPEVIVACEKSPGENFYEKVKIKYKEKSKKYAGE